MAPTFFNPKGHYVVAEEPVGEGGGGGGGGGSVMKDVFSASGGYMGIW